MIWKAVAVIGMVVFAVSTIRQVSGIALADRESVRGKYQWPRENSISQRKSIFGSKVQTWSNAVL
jgi:hypothetical protein